MIFSISGSDEQLIIALPIYLLILIEQIMARYIETEVPGKAILRLYDHSQRSARLFCPVG